MYIFAPSSNFAPYGGFPMTTSKPSWTPNIHSGSKKGAVAFWSEGSQGAVRVAERRLLWFFDPDQRVGGDELGLQVGQRTHSEVGCIRVHPLVHDQRDEKPHLGDLNGNGLDVQAIEAVFD